MAFLQTDDTREPRRLESTQRETIHAHTHGHRHRRTHRENITKLSLVVEALRSATGQQEMQASYLDAVSGRHGGLTLVREPVPHALLQLLVVQEVVWQRHFTRFRAAAYCSRIHASQIYQHFMTSNALVRFCCGFPTQRPHKTDAGFKKRKCWKRLNKTNRSSKGTDGCVRYPWPSAGSISCPSPGPSK